MGTPAFPNLGKHCSVVDCRQIDFLPFMCDRCDKVFCLEHRSFNKHLCPKAEEQDVTVVICPLCAKGIRLIPDEDPNISWETHVNIDCDPSNYERVVKKKKCPVPGCRDLLTFSNTIKCKDCMIDYCLKHRFGPDHKCPGPRKPEVSFPFTGLLSKSRTEDSKPNRVAVSSSSKWTSSFLNMASNVKASAEASIAKLGSEISQALGGARDGVGQSSSSSSKGSNRSGVRKVSIDVCPKCNRGFSDPVSLVEHFERDHNGTARA